MPRAAAALRTAMPFNLTLSTGDDGEEQKAAPRLIVLALRLIALRLIALRLIALRLIVLALCLIALCV